ncbi:MAG: gliding motility-associated peptidyl-prolyl isomerase GldI [Flavobacteriaceae bacterium]|nr:gliding motility-associated peptidyl-prolyl isomerase GldI [Bacteroidia bacterium]NNK87560.1 gliding motility-associated peptidyl-prolyl isomerase GldI [Flavobacteriaceae bacterium]
MRIILIIFSSLLISGCHQPEARRPVSQQSGSFIKISAERNKKLNADEIAKIEAMIAKDSMQEYLASENGFRYYYDIKNETDSIRPKFGDLVYYRYDVSDLSGNIIYAEEELGYQTYAIDQQELFSGLREGLKLMKAGETVTFVFPSQIAYGYYGDENRIGTNIPIKCTVSLDSINKNSSN